MISKLQPLTVERIGSNRGALLEELDTLERRIQSACSGYFNRTSVVHLSDQCIGPAGEVLGWSLSLDLRDVILLAAICQSPMALRGGTDRGKTALAELAMNALFGSHGEQWWRVEISKGMSLDDLIEVDIKKLSTSKLSEAISAAPWLSYPARLLDEINRAPAKLNNILLHIIDASGLHVRGNLYIPVGLPYAIDGVTKRYSFTIATANESTEDYDGVFAEDAALLRRIVLSINLDDIPPSTHDVAELLRHRRPRTQLPQCGAMTVSIIRVYESLADAIPISALGHLFLHYLSGLSTCVLSRSGKLRMGGHPELCEKCHLRKSHRFCGRVGGLTEGLLLWTKEIATAIAGLRAVKVLHIVKNDCDSSREEAIQKLLASKKKGQDLYEDFREQYLQELAVTGEDIVAAYTLIAPNHVYVERDWLDGQESYEKSQGYAFADIAAASWASMQECLRTHRNLFSDLVANAELSPENQAEVEALVTTEDAAMLSVISALRDEELPLKYREALLSSGDLRTTVHAA